MLEIRNIAFSYRFSKEKVLEDVSLVASPGEAVAITGANGCGKTTLMKILAAAMAPDAGSFRIDGRDVLANPAAYRRTMGYLPEKPVPYEEMTVKHYLQYCGRLKGESEKRLKRRIAEASETCRITQFLDRPVRNLSFGLKKRVALADAILLRPRVLLLDDPLAGLDAEMREVAGAAIASVAAFSCVIATGHELESMSKWATRFLVLSKGRITASVQMAGADVAAGVERVRAALKGMAA